MSADRPGMAGAVGVVVAHRTRLVRDLLVATLEDAAYRVVGEAQTCQELVAACHVRRPSVAITEGRLADGDVHEHLHDVLMGSTRILVLASHPTDPALVATLLAGASGYVVLDEMSPSDLVKAVEGVARGAAVLHPDATAAILDQWRRTCSHEYRPVTRPLLTGREQQVLQALVEGLGTKAIARRIGMATKTVEHHKTRLFSKLGVRNQAEAVSAAITARWLEQEPSRRSTAAADPER